LRIAATPRGKDRRPNDLTVMASAKGALIARVYALLNVRFAPIADLVAGSQRPLV